MHLVIFSWIKIDHRVMKWAKAARDGTVVAGGQGQGIAILKYKIVRLPLAFLL